MEGPTNFLLELQLQISFQHIDKGVRLFVQEL